MAHPSLVPVPADVQWIDTDPFSLDGARLTGESAAIDALHAILPRGLAAPRDGDQDHSVSLTIEQGTAESYRLDVSPRHISIVGGNDAGLFYGVQTLGQLVDPASMTVPAVVIHDTPRFSYRGAMVDVARHFHDVATISGVIDRIASLKLNVLHLHLTDDQGWRIEVGSRPDLVERASSSAVGGDPGGYFTEADYRALVTYAAARHITVVPEVDLPGHTHAVGLAYPELVAPPVVSEDVVSTSEATGSPLPAAGEPYIGIAVGFSSLRMDDPLVDAFVDDVVGDLAAMTPGPYVHIGGDEALGTDPAAFARFMAGASASVVRHGKTPIAWHEAGRSEGLAPGTIGQYWGFVIPDGDSGETARRFARGGGKVILSPADAVYLDMKYDEATPLGLTWAKGPTSVARSYAWDPLDIVADLDESNILGIEAPLWTETIRDAADIDTMAFPRIAAAAEIAWSPEPERAPLRSWASFRDRIGGLAPLWRRLGIRFHASDEVDWRET